MKTRNSYFGVFFIRSAERTGKWPRRATSPQQSVPPTVTCPVRSDIYVPPPGRLTLTAFPNYIFVYARRQWSPPTPARAHHRPRVPVPARSKSRWSRSGRLIAEPDTGGTSINLTETLETPFCLETPLRRANHRELMPFERREFNSWIHNMCSKKKKIFDCEKNGSLKF